MKYCYFFQSRNCAQQSRMCARASNYAIASHGSSTAAATDDDDDYSINADDDAHPVLLLWADLRTTSYSRYRCCRKACYFAMNDGTQIQRYSASCFKSMAVFLKLLSRATHILRLLFDVKSFLRRDLHFSVVFCEHFLS